MDTLFTILYTANEEFAGAKPRNTFDLIDNLVYFYDTNIPDRLIRVLTYFLQTPSLPSPHSAHPLPLK